MDPKKLTIILAEDDDGHATLIRRNLQRAQMRADIVRMRDGQELVDYMSAGTATKPNEPILVLLDIRMPKMDGLEALQRLKSNRATRHVPVFMLTTTDNPVEVNRCFHLGCNAYIMKPVSYQAFTLAMERLCAFLEVSQVPTVTDTENASA